MSLQTLCFLSAASDKSVQQDIEVFVRSNHNELLFNTALGARHFEKLEDQQP